MNANAVSSYLFNPDRSQRVMSYYLEGQVPLIAPAHSLPWVHSWSCRSPGGATNTPPAHLAPRAAC